MTPEKILFIGTRPLASQCLDYLIARHGSKAFAGVLTIDEGSHGWWREEGFPEVWQIANAHNIPLVAGNSLASCDFDMIVTIYWGDILPENILAKAKYGAINLHTAPLPEYRGSHSYSHALLNGDKEYGATLHHMSERVDQGDIINAIKVPVAVDDTARSLYLRTAEYSFTLFKQSWDLLLSGKDERISQQELVINKNRNKGYYSSTSLEGYQQQPEIIPSRNEAENLFRALHNPPKSLVPGWLCDMCPELARFYHYQD